MKCRFGRDVFRTKFVDFCPATIKVQIRRLQSLRSEGGANNGCKIARKVTGSNKVFVLKNIFHFKFFTSNLQQIIQANYTFYNNFIYTNNYHITIILFIQIIIYHLQFLIFLHLFSLREQICRVKFNWLLLY